MTAKQIEDIADEDLKKKIHDGYLAEINSLIEKNKQEIEEAEKHTEYFVDVYNTRKAEIEKHIENLSPRAAYEYLVEYEIELSKNVPADDDYDDLNRYCRKQIDSLKSGDVKKFVELSSKKSDTFVFRVLYLTKLLAEYKKTGGSTPGSDTRTR